MLDTTVAHAACLGCGCTCDDITVVARSGRIVEARNACSLGAAWFGDGVVPARITSSRAGNPDIVHALADAVDLLRHASRPLVYLAADIPCESQRLAIAIADVVGAALDSITTATAGPGILAGQRRGSVTATMGEIRNRADTIVCWGIDPADRYPRYASRCAPAPIGLYVPDGRAGRRVIAVDVGDDRGPADADLRLQLTPAEEITALTLARAAVLGGLAHTGTPDSIESRAARFADVLRSAKYAAVVTDGESSAISDGRRSEALLLLVEAVNASTRCVLSTLRGGGNRSGADAAMTWQTGFPMAVDFDRGAPSYRPHADAAALLQRGDVDVVLVVGAPTSVPAAVRTALAAGVSCIGIGPGASASPYPTMIAIDTGRAGIHERGTVVRMDDVSLPLRPALEADAVAAFRERPGSRALAIAHDTATTIYTALGAAGRDQADAAGRQAARIRAASPEIAIADALAADGRPQDSYVVLRALAAALAGLPRAAVDGALG